MFIIASVGSVLGTLFVLAIFAGIVVAKIGRFNSTRCAHCGHDNGISGANAPVCPQCGRNKTILNPKKARKR